MARSKRRNWVNVLGAHGPGKIKTEPKIKSRTSITDPDIEYHKAVAELEREMKLVTKSEPHILPKKQLQLAQVHKDQVFAMGFKPEMAELGFFVTGLDRHTESLEARRLWETATLLENQAKKPHQKRV